MAAGRRTPRTDAIRAGLSSGQAALMTGPGFAVAGGGAAVLTCASAGGPVSVAAVPWEPPPHAAAPSATADPANHATVEAARRRPRRRPRPGPRRAGAGR